MKRTLILILVLIPQVLFAAKDKVNNSIAKAWGTVKLSTCGVNHIPDACIGKSKDTNCERCKLVNHHKEKDEYAILLMIAHKINEHGAMFCPTQADGANSNGTKAWTEYRYTKNNRTCVWLCKDGYSGDNCQLPPDNPTNICDTKPFKRENYDNADISGSDNGNIEDQIPMFELNKYERCGDDDGDKRKQEHDLVLAINKWLPSGNGAYARKMVINAYRMDRKNSCANIYPATGSQDILVCKNGYKSNPSGTDCEPINPSNCSAAIASSNMCSGWNLSNYDEKQHVLEIQNECYKYACSQSGYAFTSTTNHTCVECSTNLRGGPHPENGTCIKCTTGKIFNSSDKTNNYCSPAVALTKQDMMYGRGKTKSSAPSSVSKQCWTKNTPDEYRDCIFGNDSTQTTKSNTTTDTDTNTGTDTDTNTTTPTKPNPDNNFKKDPIVEATAKA